MIIDEKRLKEIDELWQEGRGSEDHFEPIMETCLALWRIARAAVDFQEAWYENKAMEDVNNALIEALENLPEVTK